MLILSYSDEKKQRYFKVEKGATAPSDAAWSSDKVKKRKLEDAASVEAIRRLNLNKNRVMRSRAVNQPLMGGFFARECGERDLDLPAAAFAQGLVEKGKIPLADASWGSNTNVKHMLVAGKGHKNDICTAYASKFFHFPVWIARGHKLIPTPFKALDETVVLSTYIPRDPTSGRYVICSMERPPVGSSGRVCFANRGHEQGSPPTYLEPHRHADPSTSQPRDGHASDLGYQVQREGSPGSHNV